MARAPVPARPLVAILPGVPAALEVLGALGALDAAGAGARARGQDRNVERWEPEFVKKQQRTLGREVVGRREAEKGLAEDITKRGSKG